MAGNFKSLLFLFIIISSCSTSTKSIGEEVVNQNFEYFLTDLPVFPIKENLDGVIPIIVSDSITKNNFIINYCQDNCFDKINKEGFHIDNKTRYNEFIIESIPKQVRYSKIYLINSFEEIKLKNYIGINFYNFYINNENSKAFIIVEKIEVGGKGGTTEVYFFKNENGKWKFYKKELLLIG